jgi:hypothetical protein
MSDLIGVEILAKQVKLPEMIGHTDIALHWSINFSLYISGKI